MNKNVNLIHILSSPATIIYIYILQTRVKYCIRYFVTIYFTSLMILHTTYLYHTFISTLSLIFTSQSHRLWYPRNFILPQSVVDFYQWIYGFKTLNLLHTIRTTNNFIWKVEYLVSSLLLCCHHQRWYWTLSLLLCTINNAVISSHCTLYIATIIG